MSPQVASRPGGRSARVQAAVHAAVKELLAETDRADLTVPAIAERAQVTPSTIYRRWGDLAALLADVAVERIRPDAPPADTGSAKGDITAWAEQYSEETSSPIGQEMLRDILAARSATANPVRCCELVRRQLDIIAERASQRGEFMPAPETILDRVVAPIVYRTLFDVPPSADQVRSLVGELWAEHARPFER
ncbi:TetR/AcrR family transcriptional regulator [Jiella mangrovi]|uniref:TetR/AcrR family transcriptional regulator n=1 Tax=Jiella mangrovi TaxID=2821407 RepID=A0ABS4BC42_9HYPH|nr:TetR/AcrR family transcriptional regulator [Jiella mangrovi]MBP0614327.1 TetR/AcrR family transcriptional regulator [Jiella mangrovi]